MLLAYLHLAKWEISTTNYGEREIQRGGLISLVVGTLPLLGKLKNGNLRRTVMGFIFIIIPGM